MSSSTTATWREKEGREARARTRLKEGDNVFVALSWSKHPSPQTYEEAAEICDCAVGTIKSRVGRARATLTAMIEEVRSGGGCKLC